MGRMQCGQCGSEKMQGVEFDGSCIQCKDCGAVWNSVYSFYLARKADEEATNKAKARGDTVIAQGGSAS